MFNIAVVGATGAVGKEMVAILAQRNFPLENLHALASDRLPGRTVSFGDDEVVVEALSTFDFAQTDIALFSAGSEISAEYAPRAADAGCVVVDNSSCFRYEAEIPLVIPEINAYTLEAYRLHSIIANPNCSTIQMLVALSPLHKAAGIRRIDVATYQAVSGAGGCAIDVLASQTAARLSGEEVDSDVFPAPIAFNVIPHIDAFQDNGYTKEEMKMVWETHKILADDSIAVNPTAVRVPVFYGHSEAVHIETTHPLKADRARQILAEAAGVCVIDEHTDGGYPMPVDHAAGNDAVFVGRIRNDLTSPTGLNLWIVSDNLRKGAALNAVQIAEHLAARYLA